VLEMDPFALVVREHPEGRGDVIKTCLL
jgi:hypothetical protein